MDFSGNKITKQQVNQLKKIEKKIIHFNDFTFQIPDAIYVPITYNQ